jgi:hypothetical protein
VNPLGGSIIGPSRHEENLEDGLLMSGTDAGEQAILRFFTGKLAW